MSLLSNWFQNERLKSSMGTQSLSRNHALPIDLSDPSRMPDCLLEDAHAFLDVDTNKYRRGVCVVIWNGIKILLLERNKANKWQFVQGGIEEGDASIFTVEKEIFEEIGLHSGTYKIIAKLPKAFSYDLPTNALKNERYKDRGYIGQSHIYYLVRWNGDIMDLDFSNAEEFSYARWVDWDLNEIVPHLPRMKVDAYSRALIYFKDFLHGYK